LQFHFPSVLFGLASLLASEVRFPLSGFFNQQIQFNGCSNDETGFILTL
jgi:hypothetical protein